MSARSTLKHRAEELVEGYALPALDRARKEYAEPALRRARVAADDVAHRLGEETRQLAARLPDAAVDLIPHAVSEKTARRSRTRGFLLGAFAGFMLAYYFDPENGPERRLDLKRSIGLVPPELPTAS